MNRVSIDKLIQLGLSLTGHYGSHPLNINGRPALTNPWSKNSESSYIFISVELGRVRCGPSVSKGFVMSERMIDKIIKKEI
jgi:hypothetical protein